jgi:hypothetical protein
MSLSESFAWYDRDSSSWKTSQLSLLEDWESYSGSFPRQGIMQNGRAYVHRIWAPAISEIGGGLLPTPVASIWKGVGPKGSASSLHQVERQGLAGVINELEGSTQTGEAMYLNPCFVEEMQGYPLGWTDLRRSETP